MTARTSNYLTILHHLTRAALVLACLSISMGNCLASVLLNWQSTLVNRTVLTEEMPSEEAPVETELPEDLLELSEFTTHKGKETQRRRAIAGVRGCVQVVPTYRLHRHRLTEWLTNSIAPRRNGCGAALRC